MKRKLTRASLSELDLHAEIVKLFEQKRIVGGGTGTFMNPFTYAEWLQYDGLDDVYYYDATGQKRWTGNDFVCYGSYGTSGMSSYSGSGVTFNFPWDTNYSLIYPYQASDYIGSGDGSSYLESLSQLIGLGNSLIYESSNAIQQLNPSANIGNNWKIYTATENGGIFHGNQYVKVVSAAEAAKKVAFVAKRVGWIGQFGQGVYALYMAYGEGDTEKGVSIASGLVAGQAASWAFGFVGLAIAGPVGAAAGSLVGGYLGDKYGGELAKSIYSEYLK